MAAKPKTSSFEINEADIIEGARAVNPSITIDELVCLAEDTGKLETIRKAKELNFIVIGHTGIGKSTLINGLIGEEVAKVEEGLTTSGVTTKVQPYSRKIDEIKVVVYDSPGLEDGSGKDKAYLEAIYKTCQQEIHLVIFAVPMVTNRFIPNNPHARSMEKFTTRLTPAIWKKTIVILTCANTCEALNPQLRIKSREAKQIFFKKLVSNYTKVVHQTLREIGVPNAIVKNVKVVPTGHEYEAELLDGTLWFSNFWLECLTAIPTIEERVAMIKAHSSRLKSSKDVTDKDFQQPIYNQPIVMKTAEEKKTPIIVSVGGVMGPAVAGAAVGALGLLAGPVGAITILLVSSWGWLWELLELPCTITSKNTHQSDKTYLYHSYLHFCSSSFFFLYTPRCGNMIPTLQGWMSTSKTQKWLTSV